MILELGYNGTRINGQPPNNDLSNEFTGQGEDSTDRKPEDPKLLLVFSYVPLSIPLDVHFPAPYPLTLSFSIPSSFSKPAHNSPPTIHIPPPYSPPFFLLPLFHHNHSHNRRHRHPNVPRPPRLGATAVSGRNGPRDSN